MEVGKTYRLKGTTTAVEIVAKLAREITFSYFPNHYVFEYISGSRDLVDSSNKKIFGKNEFPLPEGLAKLLEKKGLIEELEK